MGLRNTVLRAMKEDLLAEIRELKERIENRRNEGTEGTINEKTEHIEEGYPAICDEGVGSRDDNERPMPEESLKVSDSEPERMDACD